jgi:gamma-glutamyltranspeptidase
MVSLNNQMDDFSAKPGVPNLMEHGTEASSLRQKNSKNSMSTNHCRENGKLFMVVELLGLYDYHFCLQTLNVYEFE